MQPKTAPTRTNIGPLRNGVRAHRLALGELPPKMHGITRYTRKYRRALETVVLDVHGEVSLTHAHLIDSACGHEQHAAVCRWLLRQRLDKMATADIRECSRQIANAKDARNKALRELGLDRDQADTIDAFYSVTALPAPDASSNDADTSGSHEDATQRDAVCRSSPSQTERGKSQASQCPACGGTGEEEHLPGQCRPCPECRRDDQ